VILNNSGNGTPLYGTGGALGMFGSNNPSLNDVLVRYTYFGDANLDGTIDGSDYSFIDNGYLNQLTGWYNGDFNYDGVVDGSDYTLIDNAFNNQGSIVIANALTAVIGTHTILPNASVAPGMETVPEPTSFSLVTFAIIPLLGRRAPKRRPRRSRQTCCSFAIACLAFEFPEAQIDLLTKSQID
jgi:hypothetical protein